jgi:hypothetical protein
MAKLGMGGSKPKDLEKELLRVVKDNQPHEDVFRKISAALMSPCVEIFEQAISQYRDNFVAQVTSIVQGDQTADDILLPEGTRFYRRSDTAALFVIEHKPCVRTLIFTESEEVNPRVNGFKQSYRLSLPYLIFVPVFRYYTDTNHHADKPFFSAMCVAYRNEPLTSLNDMLYHPNLPNLGRPNHTDARERDNPNGDVKTFQEMIMCQGRATMSHYGNAFELEPTNLNDMIAKLMAHFWNSNYTGELSAMWTKMKHRDKRFESLATWEKHSKEDPLFVLKVNWVPAIRLSSLIQKTMEHHDANTSALTERTSSYVGKIHDATWQKLLGNIKSGQKDLAAVFAQRLDDILKRFAANLARSMTVINNDTVRRTVQLAIAQALKESVTYGQGT